MAAPARRAGWAGPSSMRRGRPCPRGAPARVGCGAALARAERGISGGGLCDKTSLVGRGGGEVVRRAQAAKTRVAGVAGKVEGLVGLQALDGEGRGLDAAGISALADRAVR